MGDAEEVIDLFLRYPKVTVRPCTTILTSWFCWPSPSLKGIASSVFPTQGLTDAELKQYDDIFADSFRAEIPSVSLAPVEEGCAALRI
jgi:hypothetical protein